MGTELKAEAAAVAAAERPLEQLEAAICQGAANLTSAEHAWLLAVAEFDRRGGFEQWACRSTAQWLAWQVGLDLRAANEKVRVARALEQFPLISAAMADATLSYSKVRAITRITRPETEDALVKMATAGTTNHVERIVSAYRRAEPIEQARELLQHQRRGLHHRVEADGSVVITLRLAAEPGIAFLSAVEGFSAPPEPGPQTETRAQRRADAAVVMAETAYLDGPGSENRSKYLVTLHATASSMAGGEGCRDIEGEGEACDLPIGVSQATAERIMCDADVETVYTDEHGKVVGVSRRSGIVRGRLRRLVMARDRVCQVKGCGRRGHMEVHHLVHRGHKGDNNPENLTLACRYCHHRLHEGGWVGERTPQGVEFRRPDGEILRPNGARHPGDASAVDEFDHDAAAGRCRWWGDELDLEWAVSQLVAQAQTRADSLGSRGDQAG